MTKIEQLRLEEKVLDLILGRSKFSELSCRRYGENFVIEFYLDSLATAKRINNVLATRGENSLNLTRHLQGFRGQLISMQPVGQFFRSEFPWGCAEEELLDTLFFLFLPVNVIADVLMRTPLAIASKIASRLGLPLLVPSGYSKSDRLFSALEEQIIHWFDSGELCPPSTGTWYQSEFGNYRPLDPVIECLDQHRELENPAQFLLDFVSSIRFLRCKDTELLFQNFLEVFEFCEQTISGSMLDFFSDEDTNLLRIFGIEIMRRNVSVIMEKKELVNLKNWGFISRVYTKTAGAVAIQRSKEIFRWLKYSAHEDFDSIATILEERQLGSGSCKVADVLDLAAGRRTSGLRKLAEQGSRCAADAGILLMRDPQVRNESEYRFFLSAQARAIDQVSLEEELNFELQRIEGTLSLELSDVLNYASEPFLLRYGPDDLLRDRSADVYLC